jgi:hypothetical protein
MAFGNAAYRRIARHLRDQIDVHGDHRRPMTETRASTSGFTARVSGADYDDVVRVSHCGLSIDALSAVAGVGSA